MSINMVRISSTPTTRRYGMHYVGLGSLFSSILQVLSFAELGIGSALVFSISEASSFGL